MNKSNRILSLDVFRGIVVAFMIVVNSPGQPITYAWLSHAPWHGCTLADLVFPFFLFIVGISLVLALSSAKISFESKGEIVTKIIKRAAFLFAIGLLLNLLPNHFNLESLRFYGVLQRIAVCYLIAGLLFLYTNQRAQVILTLGILIAYWFIMTLVPTAGFGPNNLSPEGNVAAFIDQLIFSSSHLYGKAYDPEGFLSTFPAIATTLSGVIFGSWLFKGRANPQQQLRSMVFIGLVLIVSGFCWGLFFPMNKALWTSSYVLWCNGWAVLSLTILFYFIDIKQLRNGLYPLRFLGQHALTAYVLHVFFLKIQALIKINQPYGSAINLKRYITQLLFGWAPDKVSSLLFALSYTLFCFGLIVFIHFLKINVQKKQTHLTTNLR